jgi:hypothetical protein
LDKKDLDKRVRALTTLTKDDEIPALTTDFFDYEHPLPSVCAFSLTNFIHPLFHCCYLLRVLQLVFVRGHQFLASRPPLLEEGSILADPVSAASEAPKDEES